jgi:hypothetical protein
MNLKLFEKSSYISGLLSLNHVQRYGAFSETLVQLWLSKISKTLDFSLDYDFFNISFWLKV